MKKNPLTSVKNMKYIGINLTNMCKTWTLHLKTTKYDRKIKDDLNKCRHTMLKNQLAAVCLSVSFFDCKMTDSELLIAEAYISKIPISNIQPATQLDKEPGRSHP